MASKLRVDSILPVDGAPTNGGGGIIQVVQGTVENTEDTFDSTTFAASSLSATITPKFNTSKILIQTTQVVDTKASGRQIYLTIQRSIGGGSYSNIIGGSVGAYVGDYNAGGRQIETAGVTFLDSPTTTSAVTYKVYGKTSSNSYSCTVGGQGTQQIMVLMEVSA
tara:strand:- start:561 stop:1055 length:495 start_codon:yes stop_codon:yes gene_type:complete